MGAIKGNEVSGRVLTVPNLLSFVRLAMVPVFLLPITRIWMGEPITLRALAGTGLTLLGAAGLFLG